MPKTIYINQTKIWEYKRLCKQVEKTENVRGKIHKQRQSAQKNGDNDSKDYDNDNSGNNSNGGGNGGGSL